ncbi:MAG: trigger factor [Desulfatiglandales bacterium]
MKTSVEDISPVKKKLTVEIEAEEVNKKVDEAYRTLGKRAKIPGFRSGKIPRKILDNYFGGQVMEDVTRSLVNETLPEAVQQTNTIPLTMPFVENETLKVGQNFKYSVVMVVKPEFELKDYMGLEVEKEICAVGDEDVDKQLEEIRKANGELITTDEDRGLKEDDYAVIDYEGFEGDRALEGAKVNNFLLRIGSQEFHRDFEKKLIGLKKGVMAEIKVDFEENYYSPKLAGKSVNFKVKVVDIKAMKLPELNDDFVQNLGADFKDLDELKKRIREDLIAREEKRIDRELKMRLLKKITDPLDFELPDSLVESEINYGVENIRQNLIRAGSSMEKTGLKEEKLREELRPASEKRVKDMLVLGEVASHDDLTIGEAELSEGFREMGLNTGQEPDALRKYYETHNLLESFRQQLLEEKTLNYLVKGANVKKVEPDKSKREQE